MKSLLRTVKAAVRRKLWEAIAFERDLQITEQNRKLLASMESVGRGVGLWGAMDVNGADRIVLGDNVHIGRNAFIRAAGGLTIGANTHISRNLVLYTTNHRIDGLCIPYDSTHVRKAVSIGDNVWVGMNVCITPGTEIGDGAVIGMGTVVTGKVPPNSIIAGSKWRIIGERDSDHYEQCLHQGMFGGPNGVLWELSNQESPETDA